MVSDDFINSVEVVAYCESFFLTWNIRCIGKNVFTAMFRLLHTRVTSSKYFEKRKVFNLDEACIFLYHLMR